MLAGQSGAGASGEETAGAGGTSAGTGGLDSSGGDAAQPGGAPAAGGAEEPGAGGAGACDAVVEEHEIAVGVHVTTCSEIQYATNPPSSGQHYPIWADFGEYDFPLPRGFWVHNLEHGAVVVSYNCPDGCADEVAQASAWLAELAPDASCPAGPPRVLIVPDPELDVRWAASAWGFTLRAECFATEAFTDFYLAYAGAGTAPEAFVCTPGNDLRAPDADVCGAH